MFKICTNWWNCSTFYDVSKHPCLYCTASLNRMHYLSFSNWWLFEEAVIFFLSYLEFRFSNGVQINSSKIEVLRRGKHVFFTNDGIICLRFLRVRCWRLESCLGSRDSLQAAVFIAHKAELSRRTRFLRQGVIECLVGLGPFLASITLPNYAARQRWNVK